MAQLNKDELSDSERSYLRKLLRMPSAILNRTVQLVIEGYSDHAIARWLVKIRPQGPTEGWAFNTYRRYLRALRSAVKRQVELEKSAARNASTPEEKGKSTASPDVSASNKSEIDEDEKLKNRGKRVASAKNLNATRALQDTYLRQAQRVDVMMAIEEKLKANTRYGYREIAVLVKIGVEFGKIEVGYLRARKQGFSAGSQPFDQTASKAKNVDSETTPSGKKTPAQYEEELRAAREEIKELQQERDAFETEQTSRLLRRLKPGWKEQKDAYESLERIENRIKEREREEKRKSKLK